MRQTLTTLTTAINFGCCFAFMLLLLSLPLGLCYHGLVAALDLPTWATAIARTAWGVLGFGLLALAWRMAGDLARE